MSNDKEFLVQKIRTQYTEKEYTALDELKALDRKVKKPARVFAYSYGTLAAIIMGAGMSLVMTDIGPMLGLTATLLPGILVGILGMGLALSTYPIYKRLLAARKKKFAPEILRLSEKLLEK